MSDTPDTRPAPKKSSTRVGLILIVGVVLGMGFCASLIPSAPRSATSTTTDQAAVEATSAAVDTPEPPPETPPAATTGMSPTCGQLDGNTPADLDRLRNFCAQGILAGAVTSASAMDALLWLKVSEDLARAIRADRLKGEQLVLTWMKGWRQQWGRPTVSVTLEWRDVEIATGETTVFSGDQVTIH